MAFFEHERFACAYSIYIFPRTRSPFFHADAQANVSFAQTQDFNDCVKISHSKILLTKPL